MLTAELVRRGAARHARRTAVVCGDKSLTFGEVDAAANRIAHVLAGLGVVRGGRVGLLTGNGIWSIPVDFGCVKAGAARVPLNVRLAADEQARMLAATGVRLLVHDVPQAERAGELASRLDGLRLASLGRTPQADALDLLAEMEQASDTDPRLPAEADDPVLVIYTSGTTGALKAVVHTQESWAAITANVLANLVSPGAPCWGRCSACGVTGWCSISGRPRRRWPSLCWYLSLVDRSSDMIISGGYNVYPREVEEALLAHPAVTGAAVVGAPDDTWVEVVTAFVTLRPGATTSEDELRQAVRARLAGYKVPKTVQVIDAIPMSPVGKVLRRALREPLWSRPDE